MAIPELTARPEAPAFPRTDTLVQQCLALAIDQVDHGLLVVDAGGRLLHANRVARAELTDPDHALQLDAGCVRPRQPRDAALLREALLASHSRGLRRLVMLGEAPTALSVAVIPLPGDAGRVQAALLMLGKRNGRTSLATFWFARNCGLTAAEDQVLQALCGGLTPHEIAGRHGVALSTVRSQLAAIRAKTRSDSLRELVRRVAQLPPVAPTLPSLR